MELLTATRDERLRLVDRLQDLTEREWRTPSLCQGWTVREVLAHLVTPFLVGRGSMAWSVIRHGGLSAAMNAKAHELGRRRSCSAS